MSCRLARGSRLPRAERSGMAPGQAVAPGLRQSRSVGRPFRLGVLAAEGAEGLVPADGARRRKALGPVHRMKRTP
eukprot:7811898-Alexandrium_andersonii.AAC.1